MMNLITASRSRSLVALSFLFATATGATAACSSSDPHPLGTTGPGSGAKEGGPGAVDGRAGGSDAEDARTREASAGDDAGETDGTIGDALPDTTDSAVPLGIDVNELSDAIYDVASQPCSLLKCNGCCADDGGCLDGLNDPFCGSGGNMCRDCTQTSQTCTNGVCN